MVKQPRWWVAGLALALAAQPAIGDPVWADPGSAGRAALYLASGHGVADQYIVVFKSTGGDVHGAAVARARAKGVAVGFEYRHAISGYSARLNAEQLSAIRADPDVAYVEQDKLVQATERQPNPTWGLDRVDQRSLPFDFGYNFFTTGRGVNVYVIDSGIRPDHPEFGGRVADGYTAINDGWGANDCGGHGTHVGGTVGSTSYGVAKQVTLVPVRVLDCLNSGNSSQAMAGVDWVTGNFRSPAVVNMSLSYSDSSGPGLDQAVRNSVARGLTYVVAAGNNQRDACGYTPARVSEAITVGATYSIDSRDTSISNFGPCVDIFAPGRDVRSVNKDSLTQPLTRTGTSMAAPHVTGAAALYLAHHPTASPAHVRSAVVDTATDGILHQVGPGSPNKMLYVPGAASRAFGNLDVVHLAPGGIHAYGWAIDPDTTGPIDVHIYVDGVYTGETSAGNPRSDVGQAFPAYGSDHGFGLTVNVPDGTHDVCAYAINVEADDFNPHLGCKQIGVRHTPFGAFDNVQVRDPRQLTIEGWAIEPDTAGPAVVEVWVDWVPSATVVASFDRPDVAAAYPMFGPARGFGTTVQLETPLAHGIHDICIVAKNIGPGTDEMIDCKPVTYTGDPFGAIETASRNPAAGTIRVTGWAIDPDTTGPANVDIYVAGTYLGTFPADTDRPDIPAKHPGYGSAHGFNLTIPFNPPPTPARQACAEAVNIGTGSANTSPIGCTFLWPPR